MNICYRVTLPCSLIKIFFFFSLLWKTGNLEIFQFFLDGKRSDAVDVQDKDGNTLLHLLCQGKMNSKKREAMNLVLRAGAKTSIVNNKKESPIDLLCKQRQGLYLLITFVRVNMMK